MASISSSFRPLTASSTRDVGIKTAVTTTSFESGSSPPDSVIIKDDMRLQELGYKQHMERGFTMWSMTAFCLTGLGMLPSIAGRFTIAHHISLIVA